MSEGKSPTIVPGVDTTPTTSDAMADLPQPASASKRRRTRCSLVAVPLVALVIGFLVGIYASQSAAISESVLPLINDVVPPSIFDLHAGDARGVAVVADRSPAATAPPLKKLATRVGAGVVLLVLATDPRIAALAPALFKHVAVRGGPLLAAARRRVVAGAVGARGQLAAATMAVREAASASVPVIKAQAVAARKQAVEAVFGAAQRAHALAKASLRLA